MIRRLDAFSDEITAFCADVYGTRTLGYYNTYGTEVPDVSFYAQYSDDRLTAVLCNAFGHGSLTADAAADWEELRAFVSFLSLLTLLCSRESAERLGFDTSDGGCVMECCGTEETSRPECITPDDPSFSYREVYDLLLSCGFELGDFDAWRGDIALRVRFGTAQIVCVRRDNRTVSTASILFSSDDSAYLGAAATDPAYRGQGLAGKLVRYLTNLRPVSRILCKPHRESFYISLGFTKNGDFNLCPFLK